MTVIFTKFARKQISKCPQQVKEKIADWLFSIEHDGLEETRKRSGFHDEPLHGKRQNQRSIRLNRQWRLIYQEDKDAGHVFIIVLEVNPHDYRVR